MNPITPEVETGTIGELLVQLRLLQYGVQAAPPLIDSGNDLIAIRGEIFRAIQVKTTTTGTYSIKRLPALYHILAVVHLVGDTKNIYLDKSKVFLIPKDKVDDAPKNIEKLNDYEINEATINKFFLS